MTLPKALSIAGSDTSGGAGIQADLKTFQELDVYGMTAVTTIVSMNPDEQWAHEVFSIPLQIVEKQLDTVLKGIGVDALKTGMLGSPEIIRLIAEKIKQYGAQHIVVDPVMVCKGSDEVLYPENTEALKKWLLPIASVVTPNLFEASQLSGMAKLETEEHLKEAAVRIYELGPQYVLIKGGSKFNHAFAVDLLYDGSSFQWYQSEKLNTSYIHGAGCTYSAAITAELAKGQSVVDAVKIAKSFITEAIAHGFPLNSYVGPTLHAALRHYTQEPRPIR